MCLQQGRLTAESPSIAAHSVPSDTRADSRRGRASALCCFRCYHQHAFDLLGMLLQPVHPLESMVSQTTTPCSPSVSRKTHALLRTANGCDTDGSSILADRLQTLMLRHHF